MLLIMVRSGLLAITAKILYDTKVLGVDIDSKVLMWQPKFNCKRP